MSNIYTSAAQNDSAVIGRSEILYQSILDNVLKTAALLFVLGLTVIGAPLVLGIVFLRGFVLGFTVGFLIQETSLNGLILAAAAVLPPHNVVAVPAIMIAAGGCTSFRFHRLSNYVRLIAAQNLRTAAQQRFHLHLQLPAADGRRFDRNIPDTGSDWVNEWLFALEKGGFCRFYANTWLSFRSKRGLQRTRYGPIAVICGSSKHT